jgi:hypothetical protein
MVNAFESHEMLDRIYRIAEKIKVERVVLNALVTQRQLLTSVIKWQRPLRKTRTAPSPILLASPSGEVDLSWRL